MRKAKGYTQKQLADAIGVDQSCVHFWETGATFPRLKHINALSKTLGCSVTYLVASLTKGGAKDGS